jgi:hypothetical protein
MPIFTSLFHSLFNSFHSRATYAGKRQLIKQIKRSAFHRATRPKTIAAANHFGAATQDNATLIGGVYQ